MNWDARLTRAEERGEFSPKDKRLAQQWTTCAVGENRGRYDESPSQMEATPRADGLDSLGCTFYGAISRDNIFAARAIYDRIQAWFVKYGKAA